MAYTHYTRPKAITVVCVLGFFLVLIGMPVVFSPETRKLGDFYPALYGALISLRFIGYIGLWHYKKWGVELFLVTFVAQVIVDLILTSISTVSVTYHLLILILLLFHYRKMDGNL
jgi:hypothetical protein